jgi:hypothetical protein
MTPTEINELAAQVLHDRLIGFEALPGKNGRVLARRVLPATPAEVRWQAFMGEPTIPVTTQMVPPAIVKLAAQFKAAKR